MPLNRSELSKIREQDLSTDQRRKEVGSDLMDTVKSGGQEGIEAAQILVENNMSYYAYEDRAKIQEGLNYSDNFSYIYACGQLIEFVYQNHGVFEELPKLLLNLLDINSKYCKQQKSYSTKLYRFYDRSIHDGISETGEEKLGEEIEIVETEDSDFIEKDKGTRIHLVESDQRGTATANDNLIEFEIYDRTSKTSIDQSLRGVEYLEKSILIAYDIVEDIYLEKQKSIEDQFVPVVERMIEIANTMLDEISVASFRVLSKIAPNLNEEQEKLFVETTLMSIQDGFSVDPSELLLDYVIEKDGNIPLKTETKDTIKNRYNISEDSGFLLTYETDTELRKAYLALSFIDGKEGFSFTMVNVGFTQFYYRD